MQAKKTEILEIFAARLNGLMQKNGFTLQGLADELESRFTKVSRSAVGSWTQGQNFPSMELIPVLANILKVRIEFLLYGISDVWRGNSRHGRQLTEIIDNSTQTHNVDDKRQNNVNEIQPINKKDKSDTAWSNLTREDLLDYFEEFLDEAELSPTRLGWTYEELKEKFPLNKWPVKED